MTRPQYIWAEIRFEGHLHATKCQEPPPACLFSRSVPAPLSFLIFSLDGAQAVEREGRCDLSVFAAREAKKDLIDERGSGERDIA